MGIERGQDWGVAAALPHGAPVVSSDAELRSIVLRAYMAQEDRPIVGLAGGDLCKTVGGRGDTARLSSDEARTLPCDAVELTIDGRHEDRTIFVAHLIGRRSRYVGRTVTAMNAAWIGRANLAPRAHPGDGLVDVVDNTISGIDRLRSERRAETATHVPHPDISITRRSEHALDFVRPVSLFADGVRLGRARHIDLRVLPDFFAVVV